MASAIRDMGGVHRPRRGGDYLLSRPLRIPPMYNANMQFGHGTLRASAHFSGDFLFVIGVEGSCKVTQGSCNIDINLSNMLFDAAHIVAGGLRVGMVMGVTMGRRHSS